MKKVKTCELSGSDLDRAVMMCEGFSGFFYPSEDWEEGGQIIEMEGISIIYDEKDARGSWYAVKGKGGFLSPDHEGSGRTPLVAAMRCYVASKLGDTVELPE